ncbi:MAG: hypothetical protein U1E58_07605 [Tabrizicola sp.]
MPKDITSDKTATTVTEGQLLRHLLDAPYRTGPSSTLFKEERNCSLRDFVFGSLQSDCLEYDLPSQYLDQLCECEEPYEELQNTIQSLEDWVAGLKELKREFSDLKAYWWTGNDDESADLSASENDDAARRSILPAIGSLCT